MPHEFPIPEKQPQENIKTEREKAKKIKEAQKRAEVQNAIWNGGETREIGGKERTLRECYDQAIVEARETFVATQRVLEAQKIPESKHILYVSATSGGIMRSLDAGFIDSERLEKACTGDTGKETLTKDFQADNMRYCLGIEEGDSRFRAVNAFTGEFPPEDLSDCVGIVFSGSEVDIHETRPEHLEFVKKVKKLVGKATELKIPKLGICFGSQLLADAEGVKIGWVDGNKKGKVVGVKKVLLTEKGKSSAKLERLPGNFFVAESHRQEMRKETMPPDAEILAVSETGAPEIVFFPKSNSLGAQGHIEVGPGRMAIKTEDPFSPFEKNINKGRVIFGAFLKMVGVYAGGEKAA